MIFNTWKFAVFASIFVVLYALLPDARVKRAVLIAGGLCFYAASGLANLALIVALAVVVYLAARAMLALPEKSRRREAIFLGGVLATVATLCWFKYAGLLASTTASIAGHALFTPAHIAVPLAISFFTFEFIHVLVDVRQGRITKLRPLEFSAFTAFFPTLVAGPIKRYESFAPQIAAIPGVEQGDALRSLYRMVLGVAKKCIVADSMTPLIAPLTQPAPALDGRADDVVAIVAYAVKIYFDFSGYSDIAIGTAGLLGFRIPENFLKPYRARNIAVFWRRWHASLSSWIRDYVFIPLGGSRRPPLHAALNLLVAMFLAGLWHGAAWTFAVWGLWHGAGLAIHRFWTIGVAARIPEPIRTSTASTAVSTALTFAFVCAGWLLFAAPSFDTVGTVVHRIIVGR